MKFKAKGAALIGLLVISITACGGASTSEESAPTTLQTSTTMAAQQSTTTSKARQSLTVNFVLDIEVARAWGQSTCGDDSPANFTIRNESDTIVGSAIAYVVPGTLNCKAEGRVESLPESSFYTVEAAGIVFGTIASTRIKNDSVTAHITGPASGYLE